MQYCSLSNSRCIRKLKLQYIMIKSPFFFFSLLGGLARFYSATIIAPIEIIKTIQTGAAVTDRYWSHRLHVHCEADKIF